MKISVLTLRNDGMMRKKLTLSWFVEWVLGVTREMTQYQIRTSFDEATQSMFARNYFDAQFASMVSFASISERVAYYTADRREFLGRNGSVAEVIEVERSAIVAAEPLRGVGGPDQQIRCSDCLGAEIGPGEALVWITGAKWTSSFGTR